MASDVPRQHVIATVGAGRMGRGIAITFAMAGHGVRIVDIKERSSEDFDRLRNDACREVELTLNTLCDMGVLDEKALADARARVSYFAIEDSASALTDADIIFEAVPETLAAKENALSLVSRFAQPATIVASTTSTILSDALQPFMAHPERFLNAHWLNPAYLIPLVEVSPGRRTDSAVVTRLNTLLESMGKVPVVCLASPGYIVPRIQALAMNEAARMVEEGVASVDDIDKATKYGFGFRFAILGLLEFIDWGGGDILYYASRYMTQAMDSERYASPAIIENNMRDGRIGLSTRNGFLDYSAIDVNEYQREKLTDFVAMLRHIGKLPAVESTDVNAIVQQFLNAMDNNESDKAQKLVTAEFHLTIPGGRVLPTWSEVAGWITSRYVSLERTVERFDQSSCGDETIVYCFGTLDGEWVDGSRFTNVRFVDRLVLQDGLISSQLMWIDQFMA